MFTFVKKILKITLVLVAIAVIFDFHYQGKSAREYARIYGWEALSYLYTQAKSLVGKDIEDLAPKSFKQLPGQIEALLPSQSESKKSVPLKGDALTPQDREALDKLLKEKLKKHPSP